MPGLRYRPAQLNGQTALSNSSRPGPQPPRKWRVCREECMQLHKFVVAPDGSDAGIRERQKRVGRVQGWKAEIDGVVGEPQTRSKHLGGAILGLGLPPLEERHGVAVDVGVDEPGAGLAQPDSVGRVSAFALSEGGIVARAAGTGGRYVSGNTDVDGLTRLESGSRRDSSAVRVTAPIGDPLGQDCLDGSAEHIGHTGNSNEDPADSGTPSGQQNISVMNADCWTANPQQHA